MPRHAGEFGRLSWGRFKVLRFFLIAGYLTFYVVLAALAFKDVMGWPEAVVVGLGFLGTNLIAVAFSFAAFRRVADERDAASQSRLLLELLPKEEHPQYPMIRAAMRNESMLRVPGARLSLRGVTPG